MDGHEFEQQKDLASFFSNQPQYIVDEFGNVFFYGTVIDSKNRSVFNEWIRVATISRQYAFYNLIQTQLGIDWHQRISRQIRPDYSLLVYRIRTLFIIECKFQKVGGSADEKLQTCDFKLLEYQKLLWGTGIDVRYFYILNDYFRDPKYRDWLEYIEFRGCRYFFNQIPLFEFGLPI